MNTVSKSNNINLKLVPDEIGLEKISSVISDLIGKTGIDIEIADIIELSVVEICQNALRHGAEGDPSAELQIYINNEEFKAVVTNSGPFIDFDDKNTFDISQDFMNYKNGGLGIPLVKKLMDKVEYERTPENLNKLTIIKYLSNKGE